MRKMLFLIVTILSVLFSANIYAADTIEIYIDGSKLESEAVPVNINERVLVPVRSIFEALGARITWNGESRMVRADLGGEVILLTIDKNNMAVGVYNSEEEAVWSGEVRLDVPAQIINDYTYVPVRAVSEALHTRVSWDGVNNAVLIDSMADIGGSVYYVSASDYNKLYVSDRGVRRKISEKSVSGLEVYEGCAYYTDKNTGYLYRNNIKGNEECLLPLTLDKLSIKDGWVYYRDLSQDDKKGPLFRTNLDSGETERLTDGSVLYPRIYRDFIYFNKESSNEMYALSLDGATLYLINIGDSEECMYTFNCLFYGDYILLEDGAWFGNIMRINLDGSDVRMLTQCNSIIAHRQNADNKIVYVNPTDGQDIYCVNTDGSNNHMILDGDPSWIELDILAQYGDMIYYKNTMRSEIYRIKLDGSDNTYLCYADDVSVFGDRLVACSSEGLYIGGVDADDLKLVFSGAVERYTVKDDIIYVKDKSTGRLHVIDFNGNRLDIANDVVSDWAV